MATFAGILVLLLGMTLGVQVIAALYGFIDLRYTFETAYARVWGRVLVWTGFSTLVYWALPMSLDAWFLWGMIAYAILYGVIYRAYHRLFARNTKPLTMNSRRSRG